MSEIRNPKAGSRRRAESRIPTDEDGSFGFRSVGLLSAVGARLSDLSAGWFALFLGGLVFVAFPQVLLGLETFVLRDFGLFVYPLAHYQRECFWHGELPFWNPYNNCGVPFLAQWNTMPLYPPALIYLLLPLSWSLTFFDLLHLWFAGLGMYFLAYRWTGNRLGASLAGLVFAFNGLSLNLLMWPSHMATLSWMPWVVLAVEQAWRKGGRKVILAALAGGMQMLAGGPETILLTWLFLTALWVCESVFGVQSPKAAVHGPQSTVHGPQSTVHSPQSTAHSPRCTAQRFGLVVLLVAALAAAQLLPFMDLAAHSQRERGYADTSWSLPARGWTNFLVPRVFGSTWNQDVFFQYGQYWTSSYYPGVGTLLLGLLAVWGGRERRVWLLAGAAGVAFICALGDKTFVYEALRKLLPQLTLMNYPVKFVTVIIFAGPLLAGYGVALVCGRGEAPTSGTETSRPCARGNDERRSGTDTTYQMERRLVWLGCVLLALIAAILRNGLSRAALLVTAAIVLVLLRRTGRGRWPGLLSLVLLLVVWLDLWTHEPNQNPTVTPEVYQPGLARSELAMKPEPKPGEARVMVSPAADEAFNRLRPKNLKEGYLAKRLGYFSDCNLLDEVPKVNGFFSLYPRESAAVTSLLYGSTNTFPGLEDFLSVAHVTAPGEFTKWERRGTYLPWATAGQRPVFLDDPAMLDRLASPDFDGGKVVMLPPSAKSLVSVTDQTDAQVLKRRFSPRRVDLEVEAAAPALVVVSQTYYHDWRAYVDGKPAPLLRANYAFQAVQVPAGKHDVRLVYKDRAFQIGASISALGLLGCVAGWIGSRRAK